MKSLRESVRSLTVVSTISLLFVAPALAQQEVSPDRFESVATQNGQHATQKKSAHAPAKNQTAKVRYPRSAASQTASSKIASAYTQIASK